MVTLALVLDASGFPKSSEIFPGNAKESQTLEKMLSALQHDRPCPTVNLHKRRLLATALTVLTCLDV